MTPNWLPLESISDLEQIKNRSHEVPCLIFKHSPRCEISAIAKYRLEDDWAFGPDELESYYLDVISSRTLSQQVAETFSVHHESPQALIIVDGACIFDASHLDITVSELQEGLSIVKQKI